MFYETIFALDTRLTQKFIFNELKVNYNASYKIEKEYFIKVII